MFYSRLDIDPLNLDLEEMLVPDGSRNLSGTLCDGKLVDIRLSSYGWITVRTGSKDEFLENRAHQILKKRTWFYYIDQPNPEVFCNLLGLTIKGKPVETTGSIAIGWDVDRSGKTTYWHSYHKLMPRFDLEVLFEKIKEEFSEAYLIQKGLVIGYNDLRAREVDFVISEDESCSLCFFRSKSDKNEYLNKPKRNHELIDFEINFDFRKDVNKKDAGITSRNQIQELGLDISTINYRGLHIYFKFMSENKRHYELSNRFVKILNNYFCRGLDIIDLDANKTIKIDIKDEHDELSYSKKLREWANKQPNNYIFASKTINRGYDFDKDVNYVGYKPTQKN